MRRKAALGRKDHARSDSRLASRLLVLLAQRHAHAGAADGRSDDRDPRQALGRCAGSPPLVLPIRWRKSGAVFPPPCSRCRDRDRNRRFHAAQPRLAEPGAAGTTAPGGNRRRTGSASGPGAMRTQITSPHRSPHRPCCASRKPMRTAGRHSRSRPWRRRRQRLGRRDRRPRGRDRLPPPLGRRRAAPTISGRASSVSPGRRSGAPRARSPALTRAPRRGRGAACR